jgi:hypothetical protein
MRRIAFYGLVTLACIATLNCGGSNPTAPDNSGTGGGGGTGGSGSSGAEPVVFSDGLFNDNLWDVVVQVFGPGGTADVGHLQIGGIGNSDYRRTILTVNSAQNSGAAAQVAAFSINRDAVYFPSSNGAIVSIDYAEQSILLPGGIGQTSAPALRQNGTVYTLVPGGGAFSTPDLAWTPHTVTGRTQNDFRTLESASEHPDFSTSGGRIEFGFMRLHSVAAGSPGETSKGGIDDWRITLNR